MLTFDDWVAGGLRTPVSGHQIFVREDGPVDGKPMTLLHGFPTSSHDWSLIVPALVESGCRVTITESASRRSFSLATLGASSGWRG